MEQYFSLNQLSNYSGKKKKISFRGAWEGEEGRKGKGERWANWKLWREGVKEVEWVKVRGGERVRGWVERGEIVRVEGGGEVGGNEMWVEEKGEEEEKEKKKDEGEEGQGEEGEGEEEGEERGFFGCILWSNQCF